MIFSPQTGVAFTVVGMLGTIIFAIINQETRKTFFEYVTMILAILSILIGLFGFWMIILTTGTPK